MRNPRINTAPRSMSDGSGAAAGVPAGAATDTTESSRKRVSKREFLASDGTIVKSMEEATGGRYSLVYGGQSYDFDMQFGDAGKPATMFGIMGFHTKLGNVANTVLNDKDEPGDAAAAADAINSFLELVQGGEWAERGAGGVGAKIDLDALTEAVCRVAEGAGKPFNKAKVRELVEDPARRKVFRAQPAIASEYTKIVGRPTKSLDEVLGDIGG